MTKRYILACHHKRRLPKRKLTTLSHLSINSVTHGPAIEFRNDDVDDETADYENDDFEARRGPLEPPKPAIFPTICRRCLALSQYDSIV